MGVLRGGNGVRVVWVHGRGSGVRGGVGRYEDILFCFGDGEEELVFPVTADTGGAHLLGKFDDTWRVGAFGNHVTGQDEVVALVVEFDLVQQMLEFLATAVNIAHKDKPLMLVLLGQMLLVHVTDLNHALEGRLRIVAKTEDRCIAHQAQLLPVGRKSRAQERAPGDEGDKEEGTVEPGGALDAARYAVGGACEGVLPLQRSEEIVVGAIEVGLFVGNIDIMAVIWDQVDKRTLRRAQVMVVRHRDDRRRRAACTAHQAGGACLVVGCRLLEKLRLGKTQAAA